jgi:hypothetical protein
MSNPTNQSASKNIRKAKKPQPDEDTGATTEQVLAAYKALGRAQLLLLHNSAKQFIEGTSFTSPEDLVYEVLTRMLDGRRKWDGALPMAVFIHGAMRSIVSHEREIIKRHEVFSIDELMREEHEESPEYFVVLNNDQKLWERLIENQMSQNPEDALIEQQYCQQLHAQKELVSKLLSNKPTTQAVFEEYLEGASASALMKKFALSPAQYQQIKREIRTTIRRIHMPNQ